MTDLNRVITNAELILPLPEQFPPGNVFLVDEQEIKRLRDKLASKRQRDDAAGR